MSYNKIELSKMTMCDFSEIKDTLIYDFDDFWNISTFTEELSSPNSYYLVAKIDNEIVGFVGIKIILDEADIMNIVTKKNKRNLGIASYMLKELIYIAKEKNLKRLTLEVNENNLLAIHLYENFNFEKIAIRKNYYNNTENAIIMQLSI